MGIRHEDGKNLKISTVPFPTDNTSKPWFLFCMSDKKLSNLLGDALRSSTDASRRRFPAALEQQ